MIEKFGIRNVIDLMLSTEKFRDKYRDFYFTVNRERKYFNKFENAEYYLKQIKKGEICLYEPDYGILTTWGFSDKSYRVYLKLLYTDMRKGIQLLRAFLWKYGNKDYYIKIKNDNPFKNVLFTKDLGFVQLKGEHGNDIIFYRKKSPVAIKLLLDKDLDYDLLYKKEKK